MHYKNVSTPCLTIKQVKARFGSAKFTDTAKSVCAWVQEHMDKYDRVEETEEGRADTSFASEAMGEVENPCEQTRMVV